MNPVRHSVSYGETMSSPLLTSGGAENGNIGGGLTG